MGGTFNKEFRNRVSLNGIFIHHDCRLLSQTVKLRLEKVCFGQFGAPKHKTQRQLLAALPALGFLFS